MSTFNWLALQPSDINLGTHARLRLNPVPAYSVTEVALNVQLKGLPQQGLRPIKCTQHGRWSFKVSSKNRDLDHTRTI